VDSPVFVFGVLIFELGRPTMEFPVFVLGLNV
jgi:hypothetical protein